MSSISERTEANESRWIFAPKLYDLLKDAAQIYLPAAATAYAGLAVIWGWGYVAEVAGTVLVVDTFLGVILKISKTVYDNSDKSKDGDLNLTRSPLGTVIDKVSIDTPPAELLNQDKIVLKIDKNTSDTTTISPAELEGNSQN